MTHQKLALSRRHFLAIIALAAAGMFITGSPRANAEPAATGGFEMIQLPYNFGALEPYIDARTMQIHYEKHYGAYTKSLNETLKAFPDLGKMKIEDLLSHIDSLPEPVRKAVRNTGGGYYNHGLFWRMMTPGGGTPQGALAEAIHKTFGSLDEFKKAFSAKAAAVFGSGWAWLIVRDGRLEITSTPNQDSPIMNGIAEMTGKPVLCLDVWEHAYYLKYQNLRAKYIEAWWNVVDWATVEKLYAEAMR